MLWSTGIDILIGLINLPAIYIDMPRKAGIDAEGALHAFFSR